MLFRRKRTAVIGAVIVIAGAATAVALAGMDGDPDDPSGGWRIAASGRHRQGARLNDVAAAGRSDVWAVGGEGISEEPLSHGVPILTRWDGARWTPVSPASLPLPYGELSGVSAVSATEVWAAGRLGASGSGDSGPAVLRFDGTAWRAVRVTGLPEVGFYLPAAVPGRVWIAVTGTSVVAVRDDARWRTTALDQHAQISAITALDENDAWVVGTQTALRRAYAAHWDGRTWRATPMPGDAEHTVGLLDVHVVSPTDVWAVGTEYLVNRPVLLHWDGTAWERRPVPLEKGSLDAVTGTAGGRLWIAGQDFDREDRPVLLNLSGGRWTKAYGPAPDRTDHVGVGAMTNVPGTEECWAVGSTGTGKAQWGRDLILRTG